MAHPTYWEQQGRTKTSTASCKVIGQGWKLFYGRESPVRLNFTPHGQPGLGQLGCRYQAGSEAVNAAGVVLWASGAHFRGEELCSVGKHRFHYDCKAEEVDVVSRRGTPPGSVLDVFARTTPKEAYSIFSGVGQTGSETWDSAHLSQRRRPTGGPRKWATCP